MFKSFIAASTVYADKDIPVPAPYIRRTFTLNFAPKVARVAITTPGFYELYVNGQHITKGYLAPYISNPNDFISYDEYDLTELLHEGKNAIGVILGNGFANQITPQWKFSEADFRAPLSVSLTLTAESELGECYTLYSDESFKTAPSPIIYDMYRYGTHYDARLERDGWCTPEFDDSDWTHVHLASPPKGDILPCTAEPIRARHEIAPVSYKRVGDFCYLHTAFRGGEDVSFSYVKEGYLYDFGVSEAGVCRLRIKGTPGQKIVLRHGEKLTDDGTFTLNSIYTFDTSNLEFIPYFQTDVYILKGYEEEIFIPSFTYHGFRYVLVEGITDEQATSELLTFISFSSCVKRRSDFRSSSVTLNKLYEMGIRSNLSNFHYFPTDCPHREKNGWTGDIAVSAEQLLLSLDCKESLRLWMRTLRATQLDSGMLPGIAPTTGWGYHWGNGPFWDIASCAVPYYVYKYDGDTAIIAENADMLTRYLSYIKGRRDERGLIAVGLGDWVQPKNRKLGILAPLELTDTVTVYDMAAKCAEMLRLIGRDADADSAEALKDELKVAIRENLIDYDTMTAKGGCQTSQALLLYFGIFTDTEKPTAYKRLIEIIKADSEHLMCGVIGLRYIFDVLIDGGDGDLAYRMITRPDEPSYGAMIERGATALCESLDENGLNESENHHFLGDIIRIFISRIAGLRINPSLGDANEICFAPTPIREVDYAEAEYDFPSGTAKCGYRREGESIIAYIDLPSGVMGIYTHSGASTPLCAGYNEFVIAV